MNCQPVIFHAKPSRPRLVVYRVGDPGWRWIWNRYDTATIGVALVLGRRCVSLVWARPVSEVLPREEARP